jgi:hypothetical protein
MKTNINNGTLREAIYTGLWNYGARTRGVTPAGADIMTATSYARAKATIDSSAPFIVSLDFYGGYDSYNKR